MWSGNPLSIEAMEALTGAREQEYANWNHECASPWKMSSMTTSICRVAPKKGFQPFILKGTERERPKGSHGSRSKCNDPLTLAFYHHATGSSTNNDTVSWRRLERQPVLYCVTNFIQRYKLHLNLCVTKLLMQRCAPWDNSRRSVKKTLEFAKAFLGGYPSKFMQLCFPASLYCIIYHGIL